METSEATAKKVSQPVDEKVVDPKVSSAKGPTLEPKSLQEAQGQLWS